MILFTWFVCIIHSFFYVNFLQDSCMIHFFSDVILTLDSFIFTCDSCAWFINFHVMLSHNPFIYTWFLRMTHSFKHVILTHDWFIFTCDSCAWLINFHLWFLHMIYFYSHVILIHDSFLFACDSCSFIFRVTVLLPVSVSLGHRTIRTQYSILLLMPLT